MRQYNIQETKEVTKIICNKCGKEIAVEKEWQKKIRFLCRNGGGIFRKRTMKCMRLICVRRAMTN